MTPSGSIAAPRATRSPFPPAMRGRAGATILEMALTLGILLGLTFGTIEFGHFFFLKNTVQAAAREGSRAAIVPGGKNEDVTTAVTAVLTSAGLTPQSYTITVKVNDAVADASSAVTGQRVEVSVAAPWGTVGLRPLGVIGTDKSVRGTATMRREGT